MDDWNPCRECGVWFDPGPDEDPHYCSPDCAL